MGRINIDEIKKGMILEKPIYTHNSVLLLGKGVELTDKNILIMKSWGVTEAQVEGFDSASIKPDSSEEWNKKNRDVVSKMEQQFADSQSNIVMQEIFRIAKKQMHKAKNASTSYSVGKKV